jgi:hypothetical protein
MSFPCPSCKTPLYIRGFYFSLPNLGAILLSTLLGYSFGLRFPKLLLFMVLLQVPATVLLMQILVSNFNPRIKEYKYSGNSLDLFPRR